MKAIQALVSAGRRRRFLLVAAGVMFAVFALLASSYTALTLHDSIVEWESGIRYLERGPYSKAENERLKSAIRGATSIDFLAVNLNSSVNTFREDFTVFFQNPEHRMRVLFADPDSSFYKEAMVMTNKGIEGNTRASVADKGKLYFAQSVISGAAGDHPNAVEFREYDTQFRLPIILIDKKYCFMTVRLPPDLAQESIRVELASPSEGTVFDRTIAGTLRSVGLLLVPSTQTNANVETCERHFEEVWKYGKPLTAEPKEMPKK